MRTNRLRHLWTDGKTAVNAWLTIPSAWTAEVMAHAGFDAVTIDMQHGLIDYQTSLAMLQSISATGVVPLVRVPWNDPAAIMRALDAGACGIICPMINNRKEAEAFDGACRYAPGGYRSYGPTRAVLGAGKDYVARANDEVLAFAMIETDLILLHWLRICNRFRTRPEVAGPEVWFRILHLAQDVQSSTRAVTSLEPSVEIAPGPRGRRSLTRPGRF